MARYLRLIFRIGLGSVLLAVAIALLIAIGEMLDSGVWLFREGDPLTRQLGSICLWTFVVSGFVLLIPVIGHLWRFRSEGEMFRRVLWICFVLTLPFLASYFYFALYLNSRAHSQAG
jgi:hypothetical protein